MMFKKQPPQRKPRIVRGVDVCGHPVGCACIYCQDETKSRTNDPDDKSGDAEKSEAAGLREEIERLKREAECCNCDEPRTVDGDNCTYCGKRV